MASECQWCLYVAILAITPVAMWCKKAFNEVVSVSAGQVLMVNFEDERGGGNSLQYTVNSGDRLTEDFDSYTTHNTNDTNGADGTDDTGGWHVMEV